MQPYTRSFYKSLQGASYSSAREIIPLVLSLIKPERVIDVGCGTGEWLLVLEEHGVKNSLGVDGKWINTDALKVPESQILFHDLRSPLRLNEKFDLVISLETAEHLPYKSADTLIDTLTELGPVILFSAAIPFQGGTGHVNEQWPEYWAGYFQAKGYIAVDCIRKKIWNNDKVAWWYAQNILLFVEKDYLQSHPALKREHENAGPSPVSLIHPHLYLEKVEQAQPRRLLWSLLSRPKGMIRNAQLALTRWVQLKNR